MPANVVLVPPSGVGYCFTTWDQLFRDLIGGTTGQIPGNFRNYNYGDDTPDNIEDPWIRTISGKFDRLYTYDASVAMWTSPHPITPDANTLQFYKGNQASLDTKDGGVGGTATLYTGPFWQFDTALAGTFPLASGTLASGLVIAPGNTGGEERHILGLTEIPAHSHQIKMGAYGVTGGGQNPPLDSNNDRSPSTIGNTELTGGDALTGAAVAHNNMPPYFVGGWITRTSRLFYAVAP